MVNDASCIVDIQITKTTLQNCLWIKTHLVDLIFPTLTIFVFIVNVNKHDGIKTKTKMLTDKITSVVQIVTDRKTNLKNIYL